MNAAVNESKRWLVCEGHFGGWAAALDEEFARRGLDPISSRRLISTRHEARSLAEAEQVVESETIALAVIDADVASAARVLDFVASVAHRHVRLRLVVVGSTIDLGWDQAFRLAGAVLICDSTRRLAAAAELIEKHLRRTEANEPVSDRERIWTALPWQGSSEFSTL